MGTIAQFRDQQTAAGGVLIFLQGRECLMFIFAGATAAEMCHWPDATVGCFEAKRFENREIYVRLLTPVSGEECGIVGSVAPPDDDTPAGEHA